MSKLQSTAFAVILVYLWVMMILLGSIVLETFMIYPNVFHNPPESLVLGLQFMSVRAPSGGGQQAWGFMVVRDPAKRLAVAEGGEPTQAQFFDDPPDALLVLRRRPGV